MAKSGRNEPKKAASKPLPVVGDKRLANRMVTYTQSAIPVRTVIFMEVGDTPPDVVQAACAKVAQIHGESMHPTFIIPVRHKRLAGDVIFENEILEMVNKICEIKDGTIVLRDNAQDVDVLRSHL